MDFIDGIPLANHFRVDNEKRILREDIDEADLEFVYRQFAGIFLQLFQLDFERIGSLPASVTGHKSLACPLTFKVHDILQTAGVDTFGTP